MGRGCRYLCIFSRDVGLNRVTVRFYVFFSVSVVTCMQDNVSPVLNKLPLGR